MRNVDFTWLVIPLVATTCLIAAGCDGSDGQITVTPEGEPEAQEATEHIERESAIPPDQEKITPANDPLPPILHSDEYREPVPLPYPVNTAGAEDSAFIMPDGNTLYFWFTPDPNIPPAEQLEDGVTGIYRTEKEGGEWQQPERIFLADPQKQALDGCVFILEDRMWFCSARTGYTGMQWFIANLEQGEWVDWEVAGFDPDYEIGELHITTDGNRLYFHSARDGSEGQYDIWVCRKENAHWQEPENIAVVNSAESDGWPSLNPEGDELWFTRTYMGSPAIFRSEKTDGKWQEPELIISRFAGESSVDEEGNIYFTHHFFEDGVMLEADIYVSYRK